MLGVIGGSGLQAVYTGDEKTLATPFDDVSVKVTVVNADLVFVQRHTSTGVYSPPHLVPYAAILWSLKQLGCTRILGVCSVGSLKSSLKVGSFIVPDDFFCPYKILSASEGKDSHHVPSIDEKMRQIIVESVDMRPLRDGGVYVNSLGPRFETRAEIRWMSQVGDVVGMTASHEATIAGEMGMSYAILGLVDNMANGLSHGLTLDDFYAVQKKNHARLEETVLKTVSALLSKKPVKSSKQIIHAPHIVTVNATNDVLNDHAVVVENGKIVDILPSSSCSSDGIVLPKGTVLMPGLINAHTHSPMVYLRGYADDLPLTTWLETKIWPTEFKCVSREFVREGAELAIAEMLLGGTTCFSDMYFFPEAVCDAIEATGIRGVVGSILIEFPSAYAADAADYLAKGEEMISSNQCDRITFTVAPHSPYTVSEGHLVKAGELARKYGIPMHIHLHESESEIEESLQLNTASQFCHKCDRKCRPLENLDSIGLINESFIAVHMTQATPEDIATLSSRGAHVVHCPSSNLKLASGFCPVQAMQTAGINIALGTDGASSNNSLNMFEEMKLAAILAKGVSKSATSVGAMEAIRMATINGASALGIDSKTGSIEIGKNADIIAVDLSSFSSQPMYSPVSQLVYANSKKVSHVWVDGKLLVENGNLSTIDVEGLKSNIEKWTAFIN